MLALFSFLISKKTVNRLVFLCYAVLMTVFFGVLSSFYDIIFMAGRISFELFAARYVNGLPFFTTHVACNLALFLAAFEPLIRVLVSVKKLYFNERIG